MNTGRGSSLDGDDSFSFPYTRVPNGIRSLNAGQITRHWLARSSVDRLSRLIREIEDGGPNVTRIAQSIGESEATVRYWVRKKLVDKGFVIQAVPGHEAIGLKRVVAVVRVSSLYLPVARRVFVEMSESAYLTHYSGDVLDDSFVLTASVPAEFLGEYSRFMKQLQNLGFLSQVIEVLDFEWSRVLPMKVEAFDFNRSKWDFDLNRSVAAADLKIRPARRQKVDKTDLLIIRRLQVDARVTAKVMAEVIGLDYKRVLRHLSHVRERKLISYFRVRWLGTKYDAQTGKARSVAHRYLPLDLMVKGIELDEMTDLMLETHKLPFLWFEAGGRNYFCEALVPLELTNEVLSHLKRATAQCGSRKRVSITATGEALAFSIAPELFDQKSKHWTFDSTKSLKRIGDILLTAKNPNP